MTDLAQRPVTFRYGTRLPSDIDPMAVHAEIAALRHADDDLHIADIVSAAESPTSAMHAAFEWDDMTAGEKYREGQALYLAGSLIDAQTGARVYVSRYAETNNAADAGRLRINVRLLPTYTTEGDTPTALPMRVLSRAAPPELQLAPAPDAPASQEVVSHTPSEERALVIFRRWVDAYRHDPAVLREALRILRDSL